jgi:predicted DCC family thiol-disulfide oxidoreductase YuxK
MAGTMSVQRVDVVYDGLCRFCIRSIRVIQSLDVLRRVSLHDANDREAVAAAFPGLEDADLDDAMYAVDARGRHYRGFYAFRRLTWALPAAWWLIPLLYFPGVSFVGERVYGYVARNRSRLGCRTEDVDA